MQSMVRVLHVYRTFFPDSQGGLEEAIRQIALSTSKIGVKVKILSLTSNKSGFHWDKGVGVYREPKIGEVASCSLPSYKALKRYQELIEWADIVHYHYPWPVADVLHGWYGKRKPALLTYHSDIVRQRFGSLIYSPLKNWFLKTVGVIVSTSPQYASSSSTLKNHQNKVKIIPLGLSESSYPSVDQDRVNYWRFRYKPCFFLFVGVMRYYKGLEYLLEASQGAPYYVLLVGDGPCRQRLQQLKKRKGLGNAIFLGKVSDKDKVALMSACCGIVLPSHLRSEAFGVVLLEGAMLGKPLISCRINTGVEYVNLDGETGYVVEPANSTALREAMDKLYMDPRKASVFGFRARRRFLRYFNSENIAQRYYELYANVLSAPSQ